MTEYIQEIEDEVAPSPFIPNTNVQWAWDSTSLGYFKTCPRLYQYIMIEGWEAKEESVHLRFGSEFHQAVEDYDKERAADLSHDEAVYDTLRELLIRTDGWDSDPDTRVGKYKNRRSLIRTVIWYLDSRENDNLQTYIQPNGHPAVEVTVRIELDYPNFVRRPDNGDPYVLTGHLDRVASDGVALYVEDHKTTTTTPGDYYFDQFSPNNQMSLYHILGETAYDTPIKGVIINAVQLMVDNARFVRGVTFRTDDQLKEWLNDLSGWLQLAERYAADGYWPQNDTACDKFGGCRFRSVCSKSPAIREVYLRSNFTQRAPEDRWNPLVIR